MGWAGWGAGPAGAGAAGGPSRWFQLLALIFSGVSAVILGVRGNWIGVAVALLVVGWFGARLLRPPPPDPE